MPGLAVAYCVAPPSNFVESPFNFCYAFTGLISMLDRRRLILLGVKTITHAFVCVTKLATGAFCDEAIFLQV
jgi:hypothetical protein